MEIKKGDKIEIRKNRYDVLNTCYQFDKFDSETGKVIGEYTQIELHEFNDPSLSETHLLKIYNDKVCLQKIGTSSCKKNSISDIKII